MPVKQTRRYWTLSTDGNRTPIEVTETIEDPQPMTQPQQQIQYIQIPQVDGSIQQQTSTPIQTYQQPVMMPPQRGTNPFPFAAAAGGLILFLYGWNAMETIGKLERQNLTLTQQVGQLQAENRALKEMAAIVR